MSGERFAPSDVGRILDEAIVMYRENARAHVGLALAVLLPPLLLASVASSLYYTGFAELIGVLGGEGAGGGGGDGPFGVIGVFPLLASLVTLAGILKWAARHVVLGASYAGVPRIMRGRRLVGASDLLDAAKGRYVMLLVVIFLVSLAVQAGLFALLVPGVYVAVRLAVAGPVTVVERGGIDTAFSRSWALTKGYWWRTALFWSGLALVSLTVRAAIASPVVFLVGRTILPALQSPGSVPTPDALWASVAVGVATAVGSAVVVPFEGLAWGRYYLDLRARVEGMDLVMRASETRGEASA